VAVEAVVEGEESEQEEEDWLSRRRHLPFFVSLLLPFAVPADDDAPAVTQCN
jgi:hypothetical protein